MRVAQDPAPGFTAWPTRLASAWKENLVSGLWPFVGFWWGHEHVVINPLLVAPGCEAGSVRVWDLRTRQIVRVLNHPSGGPVTSLLALPCPPALAARQQSTGSSGAPMQLSPELQGAGRRQVLMGRRGLGDGRGIAVPCTAGCCPIEEPGVGEAATWPVNQHCGLAMGHLKCSSVPCELGKLVGASSPMSLGKHSSLNLCLPFACIPCTT